MMSCHASPVENITNLTRPEYKADKGSIQKISQERVVPRIVKSVVSGNLGLNLSVY